MYKKKKRKLLFTKDDATAYVKCQKYLQTNYEH